MLRQKVFLRMFMCLALVLSWDRAAFSQDKLVIISPHWEGIETAFNTGFKEWYKAKTGREITVDWLDQGGSSTDFRFIESEFKRLPEGIGIDLFFGGGTDNYLKLADKGLLHPYKLPDAMLKRIPQEIFGLPVYDPEYRWYGAWLMKSCVSSSGCPKLKPGKTSHNPNS